MVPGQLRDLDRELQERLLPHEDGDESALYPELAKLLGGHDPLGAMSRTHRELHHLARRYGILVTDWTDDAATDAETLRDLRRILYGLSAILKLHFAQEEKSLPTFPMADRLTLFLTGDVMTGRGIDQILPYSVHPRLYESYVRNAKTYVELAEQTNGPIPEQVSHAYVWGDALDELARVRPQARIVNLETAVTTSDDWWRGKGINYRMHPGNARVLTAAGIDICVLGNNHVMDWGRAGLRETLTVLRDAGLCTAGAGADRTAAAAPAVLETGAGRLLVFSYGCPSAGVPPDWEAGEGRSGVSLLADLGSRQVQEVIENVRAYRRAGDRVVISLHWGGNWGSRVPPKQRDFAHRLVDASVADIIHGHSSHHPKGIEVYWGRPILFGAGDFLNDYEGIGGKEAFRGDLVLMYFPVLDDSGALASFEMTPLRIRRFRLEHASAPDARWLAERLDRESRAFGTRVEVTAEGRLALRWAD